MRCIAKTKAGTRCRNKILKKRKCGKHGNINKKCGYICKEMYLTFRKKGQRGGAKSGVMTAIDINKTPKIKYSKDVEQNTKTIYRYDGQAKLYWAHLSFLTWVRDSNPNMTDITVVYVGAAPGNSIPLLSNLFKTQIKKWILYDKAPFNKQVNKVDNIQIKKEFFTDDIAKSYKDVKNVVLMFDHRISDTSDKAIVKDINSTRRWIKLVDPIYAWVKFRLPWKSVDGKSTVTGPRGEIHLQPFTKQFSAETRVWLDKKDITDAINGKEHQYDIRAYEESLFARNKYMRWTDFYKHDIQVEGIDHTQDSIFVIDTAKRYLKSNKKKDVEEFINMSWKYLPRKLGDSPLGVNSDFPYAWRFNDKMKKTIQNEKHRQSSLNKGV